MPSKKFPQQQQKQQFSFSVVKLNCLIRIVVNPLAYLFANNRGKNLVE